MSEPKPEHTIDLAAFVKEASAWLESVVGPMHDWLAAHAPDVEALARGFQQTNDLFAYWDKNAPGILKRSVSAAGLMVPFSRMSFADVQDLMAIYETTGEQGVVDRVRVEYDAIFAPEGFLAGLETSWTSHHHFARRMHILRQALKAHELGMYAVSVPTLIAQFEGLIADAVQHQGRMDGSSLGEHVQALGSKDGAFGAMFSSFVTDAFLDKFKHGQASPMPKISRHAILHGGDINYGTEMNSRTVIFLIDALRTLSEQAGPCRSWLTRERPTDDCFGRGSTEWASDARRTEMARTA